MEMSDKSASLNPNAAVFIPRVGAASFVPGAAFHQQSTQGKEKESSQIPSSTTPVSGKRFFL